LSPQSAHSRKTSSVSVVSVTVVAEEEEELENEDSLPKLQDLLDEGEKEEKEEEEDVNVAFFQDKTPRNPLKPLLSLKSMEKKKSLSAAECFLNDLSLFTNSSYPDKDFPDGCQNISSDPQKLKQFLEFLDYFPCTKEYLTCTLVTSQFIIEMSRHTCNYEKCLKSDKYGFIRSVVESFRRPKKASKDSGFIGGYKMLSNHDDIALFKVVQDEYELVFHTPLESFTENPLQSVSEDELLQNLKTISQDDLVHLLYVDSEEYGKSKDAFELIRMYQRLYSSNQETVNGLVYILLYPLPCQMVRLRLVLNTRNYKGLFSNVSQLFSTIHDGMILSREWLQLVLPLAVYEVHTFLLKRIKRYSNCTSFPAVQKTDKSHGPLVFSRSANSLFSSTTTAAIRKQSNPVQTEATQSLSSTKELPPLPRERVPYNPHPETRHGDVYTQRRDLLMALSRMG
jgi:hypothetical protein